MHGTLSIVATPIGNLGDITLRALETLKKADVVFAEDTRVAAKLLMHYDIKVSVHRLDAAVEDKVASEVIERLKAGEHVVYVSDAGTPGISDPGARLVARVRSDFPDATIEAIPGASALTAALSIAGINTNEFLFLGFLPHKKGRKTALESIAAQQHLVVLFESTHRIMKLLEEINEYMPHKQVTIARELTKLHEDIITGSAAEITTLLTNTPERQKGEFVVCIEA
jgi:16S rRNA (cytidine1402-2'-O)-methyltransferase